MIDEIILALMKKELKRLDEKAEKAKKKQEAAMNAPQRYFDAHRRLQAVTKDQTLSAVDRLSQMQEIQKQANEAKAMFDLNTCVLMDATYEATYLADNMRKRINDAEFRLGLRNPKTTGE